MSKLTAPSPERFGRLMSQRLDETPCKYETKCLVLVRFGARDSVGLLSNVATFCDIQEGAWVALEEWAKPWFIGARTGKLGCPELDVDKLNKHIIQKSGETFSEGWLWDAVWTIWIAARIAGSHITSQSEVAA